MATVVRVDVDYREVWSALPEDLRYRLRRDVNAPLSADDVTALVYAGQSVAMAHWVSQMPHQGDRWYFSSGLRGYIEQLRS